jgi:hypothetical protein
MATAEEIWTRVFPALAAVSTDFINEPARSWPERRKVFLEPLGGDHAGQEPDIAPLLEWLDELSASDRDLLLSSGSLNDQIWIVIQQRIAPPSATAPDADEPVGEIAEEGRADDSDQSGPGDPPEQYDLDAWYAFVRDNGTAWSGEASTWTAFCDWFPYAAAQQGLSYPAAGLLAELHALSGAGRVELLAQYGAVIAVCVPPSTPDQSPPEPAAAPSERSAREAILAQIPDIAQQVPGFHELTDQEIAEVVAELVLEMRS